MSAFRVSIFLLAALFLLCGRIHARKLSASEKEVHAVGDNKSFFPYIPVYGGGFGWPGAGLGAGVGGGNGGAGYGFGGGIGSGNGGIGGGFGGGYGAGFGGGIGGGIPIFTRREITEIVKQRRKFEYRLKEPSPLKQDFIAYIDYETQLECWMLSAGFVRKRLVNS
ncbi:hypothetical protein V6N11_003214 [Hibiscus sabdariffa]|uniref:U3 small nucleolar RNA-associated protein 6 N-terminal domain-containing protein n=1 Tax=Hibiscus sabdariffa TaxID=183260 RepID=A0ABR2SCT3_9ROSI